MAPSASAVDVARRERSERGLDPATRHALYPYGILGEAERRVVTAGGWVAALMERDAISNTGAFARNVHAVFSEVQGDHVVRQVELLDFHVLAAQFDLGVLPPGVVVPGADQIPDDVAEPPAAADRSAAADAIRTVLAFLDGFLAFDPDRFVDRLIAAPLHQVGTKLRPGREAFLTMAAAGRILYPDGIRSRVHHVLASDGVTVATLCSLRARTHLDVEYENLYGIFFDVHEGRIATMIEVLDGRVTNRAFDLSVLDG